MKKNLPLILIIASAILLIGNIIFFEGFDRGFWMSTTSSLMVIIAMALTMRANKNQNNMS